MILQADARALPLADASVDAVVTDPPYHLTQVSRGGSPRTAGTGPFGRHRLGERGFMGKTWDGGDVAMDPATWAEAFRVLRPGGRLLAFGANRTHHRIWCAIEDAGFLIEDTIMWIYGSGFPKHRSKLKPAYEPIIVARKGPVTDLNIDECRIGHRDGTPLRRQQSIGYGGSGAQGEVIDGGVGRWPANVVLDEEAAAVLDAQSGERGGGFGVRGGRSSIEMYRLHYDIGQTVGYGDSGGASRFFYCAKASRAERNAGLEGLPRRPGGSTAKGFTEDRERGQDRNRPVANHHPTVKPVDLMRWLVRLVTRPGELVLDPFTGSGTTGVACTMEGRRFIGIEKEAEYVEIARLRIAAAQPSLFAELAP